jgi:hypothetical protein
MSNFAAPPIRTPYLGNPPSSTIQDGGSNIVSWPWIQWFQSLSSFNSAPQIPQFTPASSAAKGVQNTITYDANFLYVCIAADTWRRVALSVF